MSLSAKILIFSSTLLALCLISDALRGALYRTGRSDRRRRDYGTPLNFLEGQQEFLRFGRSFVPSDYSLRAQRTPPDNEPNSIDADEGQLLRFGKRR